jgi:hypothetical protein
MGADEIGRTLVRRERPRLYDDARMTAAGSADGVRSLWGLLIEGVSMIRS